MQKKKQNINSVHNNIYNISENSLTFQKMEQQKLNHKLYYVEEAETYEQCQQKHNSYFRIFFKNCLNETAEA